MFAQFDRIEQSLSALGDARARLIEIPLDHTGPWAEAWTAWVRAAGAFGGHVPLVLESLPTPQPSYVAVAATCREALAAARLLYPSDGTPAPVTVVSEGDETGVVYGSGRSIARLTWVEGSTQATLTCGLRNAVRSVEDYLDAMGSVLLRMESARRAPPEK